MNGISLSTILLALLKDEDRYGLELSLQMKSMIRGEIKWSKTSVYPVLKAMEKEKLIRSYWRIEDKMRPWKYYSLLNNGLQQLAARQEETELLEAEISTIRNPCLLYPLYPLSESDSQELIDMDIEREGLYNTEQK